MDNKLYIGCHVAMSGPSYYLGSVEEALSYGATTFMFYTGAPQNFARKPTSELRINEARELIKKSGLNEDKIIVHAPYIINIGNSVKEDLFNFSCDALANELIRVNDLHIKTMVLHPGSHVGAGSKAGLDKIIEGLNIVLKKVNNDVKIALETMAGKGSECGISTDELKYIIDNCLYKDRLGVCLDTCHLSDAGMLINGFDAYLDDFDKKIGINKILVVHINDSKNPALSHKDRHENIGYGYIGYDFIESVVYNDRLQGIPMILETPYFEGKPPYKKEIEMLKNRHFESGWREKL